MSEYNMSYLLPLGLGFITFPTKLVSKMIDLLTVNTTGIMRCGFPDFHWRILISIRCIGAFDPSQLNTTCTHSLDNTPLSSDPMHLTL